MADSDLVDADGWISDESDFYGDDETRSELESQVGRNLKRSLQHLGPSYPDKKQKVSANVVKKDQRQNHPISDASEKADATGIAARSSTHAKSAEIVEGDKPHSSMATCQQGETVNDFLRRLPVQDPKTAQFGPWLWVHSSAESSSSSQQTRPQAANIESFLEAASKLKEAFEKHRSSVESELQGKAQATITRRLNPHRDQLERDILDAAVRHRVTCGKWMLFPNQEELPRLWRLIAEATSHGKLGPVSKVATHDPSSKKDETLICVYTYDFTDVDDVRRVLEELSQHRANLRDGKPIYYKCDAYTYLGIQSDNSFKIRASLFSSKEIFNNDFKIRWTV